jgi:hypothetical protein
MWKDMDEEGRRELIVAVYERLTVTSDGSVWMLLQPPPEAGIIVKVWDGESWTT